MNLQATPAGIAAALRRAADDIEAMGDVSLSPVRVELGLHAVQHAGTPAERVATVDALSVALVGVPGVQSDGSGLHGRPLSEAGKRGDLRVSVYTDPTEYQRGAL